jgi:hypothetical protein
MVSRLTMAAALAFTLSGVALYQASPVHAGGETTQLCRSSPHSWSGNIGLGAGESFSTGVAVGQQPGAQALVRSVAVSTGEGSRTAVVVRIGGQVATNGAVIIGGDIAVGNAGTEALHVTSVDLVITSCQTVAVADALTVQGSSLRAPNAEASDAPGLPETGAASRQVLFAALLLNGAGMVLVVIGRRRAA